MKAAFVLVVVACVATWLPGGVMAETEQPLVPCPPEVSQECPEENGTYPVYLPHPEHCSMFCTCNGGVAFEQTCQLDLLWNDLQSVCDWPENVSFSYGILAVYFGSYYDYFNYCYSYSLYYC